MPELLSNGDHVYLLGHDTLGWTTAGPWTFILPDALGSARQTTDATGAVTDSREWSPFGVEIGEAQGGLGYAGEWYDAELQQLYLRARWYAANTGRFTTEDPLLLIQQPQTLNLYSYVRNRPLFLIDPSGWQGEPFDPNNWIANVIRTKQGSIARAANRHNLLPEFLGAVLYLENNNATESTMQAWVGDMPQQVVKFLWNSYLDAATLYPNAYIEDISLGPKEWAYFKFGRSQGIGAIKPEVAMYLHSREMVYNPYTGAPLDYYYAEDTAALPITLLVPESGLQLPIVNCTVKDVDFLYLFGIRNQPFERAKMLFRLGKQEWSIEYLAAHLDAARNPKYIDEKDWPGHVSRADKYSEAALRLMVTYHYNTNNLGGWNDPTQPAYNAATQVMEWMPWVVLLLTPPQPALYG